MELDRSKEVVEVRGQQYLLGREWKLSEENGVFVRTILQWEYKVANLFNNTCEKRPLQTSC